MLHFKRDLTINLFQIVSAPTFECPYLFYSKALIFYNGKWDDKFEVS